MHSEIQEESSNFYSTYDARELVKSRGYKGIDFGYGEMGNAFSISEVPAGDSEAPEHIERSRSISYGCRIEIAGAESLNLADFLTWLAEETTKEIERGKGVVVRRRHRVGRRFYLEYTQNDFAGRIEVDGDLIAKDQLNLDVEIVERKKN